MKTATRRMTTTCRIMFASGDFFRGVRWQYLPAGTRVRITETSKDTGCHRIVTRAGLWAWVTPNKVA